MSGRYCIGSQPFKYFMETDPTVPMWVKKIQQNDIETWNTVLNKQDKLTAGKHIIIDNNEISFDHDIDLMASDFQYLPIGNERIWNDLRNYFTTQNGENFSPISIDTDTAYMQWQDGLYYEENSSEPIYNVVPLDTPVIVDAEELATGGDLRNTYFLSNGHGLKYELYLYPSAASRDEQGFIDNIVRINNEGYDLAYIDDSEDYKVLVVNDNSIYVDNVELTDQQILDLMTDNKSFYKMKDSIVNHKIYMFSGGNEGSDFYYYDDSTLPIYRSTEIIAITKTYTKVLPEDIFDNTKTYCVYNRKTDTYSTISLNENTFKERQNGLYIRTSVWDKDTLLTAKNIDQLMYDLVDTAYAHAKDTAYQNFVTNQLKDYVNGRIASLNLNTYATNTALNNHITSFNILANQVNDIDDEVDDISSTREYLITTGNGLKKTYINEETLNQVAHLDLDIRPMPDGYLNEETKKYLHLEDGYNGFYIFNDLIYQDWIYKLDAQGNYISDGEGGWQKEQLDHYVIGMPFTERLVPARVAVSSRAVLEELNDNYEMKLITLGSNVQIVDLAYYKQLWGATGATFTEADFKALTAEWYDVNWDTVTPENQAIMKMYTYNGENGERLYRHQRAITFIPSDTGDIYAADVYTAISNPTEEEFESRTEPWYTYNSTTQQYEYVSLEEEFDSNETYYTLGSQQSKYTIPSCDGVAKFVESLDLSYTGGKVYLKITERPGTDNARIVDISDTTIVDDTITDTSKTWSSNKINSRFDALDFAEVGGSGKYISKIKQVDGLITATADSFGTITEGNQYPIDGDTIYNELLNYILKSNTNGFVKNDGSILSTNSVSTQDQTTKFLREDGTWSAPSYTNLSATFLELAGGTMTGDIAMSGNNITGLADPTNNQDAATKNYVDTSIQNLPEPMIFKGSVGSGGTIEWANLPSPSSSNKGWTYKVITDNNTSLICKVGDTIISDSTTWVVIPSGDEPNGTVTNVAIQGETNYIEVSGSPITSSGTITISLNTAQKAAWNNKISGVKVNGTELTADANKKVNVIVPQVYRYV